MGLLPKVGVLAEVGDPGVITPPALLPAVGQRREQQKEPAKAPKMESCNYLGEDGT